VGYHQAGGGETVKFSDNESRQTIVNQPLDSVVGPVLTPLLQAIITGFLFGLVVGLTALFLHWDIWFPAWILSWVGSTLIAWIKWRGRWQWIIERVLGVDLDGDGQIGVPAPAPLRVEISENSGHNMKFIDLPYADRMKQLADGLLNNEPFSLRHWQQERKLFTQGEFANLQDVFIRAGLAKWKNPEAKQQGIAITHYGWATCNQIVHGERPPALPSWPVDQHGE
jgi:hypothetical protein